MNFDSNKPIYIQIADNICERILGGEFKPGERIQSVREWGAAIGVNPNTVARSYELLTEREIIYNQRGIGYFVSQGAQGKILDFERKVFLEEELPALLNRARMLGIDLKTVL